MTQLTEPTRESLTELVHDFYRDVRSDALLGPIFNGAIHDWDDHLARLVEFWCTVVINSRSFRGDVFGKHMALDGVTPEHFTAWINLWITHTERIFVPEVAQELQNMALGIARNLFRGFFGQYPEFVRAA